VGLALAIVYVLPAIAALTGSRVGALGYVAAVGGRVSAARWCGGRRGWATVADSMAHPLSVLTLLGLLASSWVGRSRGSLRWKGRAV
jgi:Na+/H+ antiporter NhaA